MSLRSHILLLILAFLCSKSMAFPSALGNTILNAHATSSGIINIQKDDSGQFYVEADLSYNWGLSNSSKSSNSPNSTTRNTTSSDTGRMMISIVNAESLVATSCSNFFSYDCSSHTCSKLSYTRTIYYPTFTASVQYAQSSIYLDYNYWSLSTSNYLYIAYSCSTYASSVGSGQSGVLGLGTGDGSSSNFGYSPIFSIYINSDLMGGKLLFKSDTSTYAQSSNSLHSFDASSTWQITSSSTYIQVGSYFIGCGGNVMFDINSNAIGLPQSYYNSFLTRFGYLSGVYCSTGSTSRPYCNYVGKLEDLPDIILSVSGSQIKIPSAIYASSTGSSGSPTYFYLNFKATSPSLYGVNYVSPIFKDSIILDANFMRYYYTVFDASSGSNYIYLYPSINGSSNPVKWVVSGAVAAILLMSICCWCAKKKRGVVTTVTATAAPLNDTSFNSTTQTPIVYNQPVNVPNDSYDANQCNYSGNNAQPQGGVYQPYPAQGYIPPTNNQESAQ